MNPSPSGIVRHWRVAAAALLCAAGGAELRLAKRESGTQTARNESGREEAVKAAVILGKAKLSGKARSPQRLTMEQLLELPAGDRLLAVLDMLPSLTADEVSMLVHAQLGLAGSGGTRITDGEVADGYLSALFTRWAEADADGMMLALESAALTYEMEARRRAVQAWAAVRGVEAVEAAGKKWPRLAQEAAWQVLLRDPGSMETLLPWLKDSLGEGGVELTATAEQMLQLLGPERAVMLAAAAGNWRDLDFVLSAIAEESLPRALAAVKALPAGGVREQALQDLLEEMHAPNPSRPDADALLLAFKNEYEALPTGRTRDALADEYATILARESPDKALEWARTLPPGATRGSALSAAAYALEAANNWEAATKVFAEARADNPYEWSSFLNYSPPIGRTFAQWHREDQNAAMAWLQSQNDSALRTEAVRSAVAQGRADISLIPDTSERLAVAMKSLNKASKPLPVGSSAYTPLNLPPDLERLAQLRLAARGQPLTYLSSEDRRLACDEAMSWIPFPESQIELFNELAPEERSLGAWYQAGEAQANMDVAAASEWLATLPPGPERDAAATALVDRLSAEGDDRDGEAAFAWAVSMSGAEERRRYIEQAAKVWAEQDAEAATKAVLGSNLPPEEAVHLVEELQKGGPR